MQPILTVAQLIELLQTMPPDAIVTMRADGGSGYVETVVGPAEDPLLDDAQVVTLQDWVNSR